MTGNFLYWAISIPNNSQEIINLVFGSGIKTKTFMFKYKTVYVYVHHTVAFIFGSVVWFLCDAVVLIWYGGCYVAALVLDWWEMIIMICWWWKFIPLNTCKVHWLVTFVYTVSKRENKNFGQDIIICSYLMYVCFINEEDGSICYGS